MVAQSTVGDSPVVDVIENPSWCKPVRRTQFKMGEIIDFEISGTEGGKSTGVIDIQISQGTRSKVISVPCSVWVVREGAES